MDSLHEHKSTCHTNHHSKMRYCYKIINGYGNLGLWYVGIGTLIVSVWAWELGPQYVAMGLWAFSKRAWKFRSLVCGHRNFDL